MVFGLDKFKRKTTLGGDIYRDQRRRKIIFTIIFALIAFTLVNVILYSLINI